MKEKIHYLLLLPRGEFLEDIKYACGSAEGFSFVVIVVVVVVVVIGVNVL